MRRHSVSRELEIEFKHYLGNRKMKSSRKLGIVVGVLFIIGTVSGISSFFLTGEMSDSHEYLSQIAAGDKQFILGSVFVLIMGFSVAFIPIILYPTLKKHNEALAVGYVVFRGALEMMTYIAIWVSMLMIVFVSKEYAASNGNDPQELKRAVATLLKFRELSSTSTIFVFGIGALLLYSAFYQSKLVPRWLSVWGVIAILLYMATGFLIMFGLQPENSDVNSYLSLPIFLQEMVMAVWLIVNGFNPDPFSNINTHNVISEV
jgi:hypothetical protein